MKLSQFNTIIPYKGKFAIYNAFTQKVIFILPELKELLDAAGSEGVLELQKYHPTFYAYLVENEFIVQGSIDELLKVKELSRLVDENSGQFILTVNPTMNCNFKCWYCYETHVKKSKLETDYVLSINKFISNTIAGGVKNFTLSFFGGEPLLYFKQSVIPVIDHFVEACRSNDVEFDISFTTNGYLVNEHFINYFRSKQVVSSLQITLDGYGDDHDKVRFINGQKGSYQQIIRNVKSLLDHEQNVCIRINYTSENLGNAHLICDEFKDIDQDLKDRNLLVDFHRVWQDDKPDGLNVVLDEKISYFRQNGLTVFGNLSPNNVRESCYADKRNSVVINYNGDIFKCTARDFTTEKRAGYIDGEGALIWEDDYLEKRMNAKFRNKPCLTCKILPLCNGGCSQHAFEKNGEDYCVYFGIEAEKDKVVKAKIDELIHYQQKMAEAEISGEM